MKEKCCHELQVGIKKKNKLPILKRHAANSHRHISIYDKLQIIFSCHVPLFILQTLTKIKNKTSLIAIPKSILIVLKKHLLVIDNNMQLDFQMGILQIKIN